MKLQGTVGKLQADKDRLKKVKSTLLEKILPSKFEKRYSTGPVMDKLCLAFVFNNKGKVDLQLYDNNMNFLVYCSYFVKRKII